MSVHQPKTVETASRAPAQSRATRAPTADVTRNSKLAALTQLKSLAKVSPVVQSLQALQCAADEEELMQGKAVQRMDSDELMQGKNIDAQPSQEKNNNTGLSDNLKSGVENLSGMSMDQVRVHRNSNKPATVGALAYAQGTDIHLASGQEKHLPHEAWHVVQQAQGRVTATAQLKGVSINNDPDLEAEADTMGAKALAHGMQDKQPLTKTPIFQSTGSALGVVSQQKPQKLFNRTPYSNDILQRKCAACESEGEALQRITSNAVNPLQLRGSELECAGYHRHYKDNPPRKCTQNHTRLEMEANVASTQTHIDGRERYIAEECDFVLPGSIAKGSDTALASHQTELDSVKRTLQGCTTKIAAGRYKA